MGEKKKRNSFLIWGLVACAAVLIVAGALLTKEYFDQQRAYAIYLEEKEAQTLLMQEATSGDTFFGGIYVEGVSIGGMTMGEAKAALQALINSRYEGKSIQIAAGDDTISLDFGSFIIETDIDGVLQGAYAIGRDGLTLEENYAQIVALAASPRYLNLTVTALLADSDGIIGQVSEIVAIPPQNASFAGFDKSTGGVNVEPESSGWELDTLSLLQDIQEALNREAFDSPVEARTIEVLPEITQEDLTRDFQLMGRFQTVAKKDSNRNTNITLAMAAIDGYVLPPGEQFSCNTVIGKRTAEKGYKTAGAIRNGVTVQELGGGVCQVSSTLFNAVARAGLEIVQRTPHSWPSDYIAAGMDATIDWPSLDFVFKNNTDSNVYVFTNFDSSTRTLTIEIYGKRIYDENVRVELRAERIKTLPQPEDDITLNDGMYKDEIIVTREGRSGSEVQTYRQFFDQEGKLISEEKYVYSVYRARATLMTMGTKTRPAAQEADTGVGG